MRKGWSIRIKGGILNTQNKSSLRLDTRVHNFFLWTVCVAFYKQFLINICLQLEKSPSFGCIGYCYVFNYINFEICRWWLLRLQIVNFLEFVDYIVSMRTIFSCNYYKLIEIWCLLLWVAFFSHNKASRGQQLQALGQWFSETRVDFSVILLAFLLLFQDGSSHYIHNQERKKRENRSPELGHITSFSLRESWEKWFLSLQAVQWSGKEGWV